MTNIDRSRRILAGRIAATAALMIAEYPQSKTAVGGDDDDIFFKKNAEKMMVEKRPRRKKEVVKVALSMG